MCVLSAAHSNELDVNLCEWDEENRDKYIAKRMAEPEEERFQRDRRRWESYCRCDEDSPFNHYDLSTLISKLQAEVSGDPGAVEAMDIFLKSDYWKFVDCCVKNLDSMDNVNRQIFQEVLMLLAPGIVSTRYMAMAVRLVGRDQKEVRAEDIQHLQFCLDMFFYAAVRNGQLGRYALADMCIHAFYAPCLNRGKDDRFDSYKITQAALNYVLSEDSGLYYFVKSIWPNWK
jgi:hypothetical protein